MTDANKDILTRAGRHDGMTVPEGYFASFARQMAASLPDRPELERPDEVAQPRTPWQRVRPYVYMAAMFAGVWCMLKMFTTLTASVSQPLEANPVIAEALGNDTFVSDYVISDLNQWDLYDELMDDGLEPDSLEINW